MTSAPLCVAVIPARGGSKGVPGKNLATVGGISLVGRAIRAALASARVDRVVVSTDDDGIAAEARSHGADVVRRPDALATDDATSEDALNHALDELKREGLDVEILAFLQATSPFIDVAALDRAIGRVSSGESDSVFAAVESAAFLWRIEGDRARGINHDDGHRPRRQDREAEYRETGAFYVMRVAGFREAGFRFFGRVGVELVPPLTAIEIDSVEELAAARALASLVDNPETGVDVDAVVMDFDGVHTDDRVTVSDDGRESVTVSRADGMGIALLRDAGVHLLILSTERNPVVAARAKKLGIEVEHGVDDKAAALRAWCARTGLDLRRVAFVGNDVNDRGCLEIVGWPVVVPGARPEVQRLSRVSLTRGGGHGAIRELADIIVATRERM